MTTFSNFKTPRGRTTFLSAQSGDHLHHEPHPQLVRVFLRQTEWNPSTASEKLDDPVPTVEPIVRSSRSSLLWEGQASSPYSVFPLNDVPIEPSENSADARVLAQLRSLETHDVSSQSSSKAVFRPSGSVRAPLPPHSTAPGSLAKNWYDLVDRSSGKVLAQHAGWTFADTADKSGLQEYSPNSLVRKATETSNLTSAGSLLFAVDPDATIFEWFDEDQRRLGTHVKNPYHRVDALRSSRHVQVFLNPSTSTAPAVPDSQLILLAETSEAVLVFESGLPVRAYLPASAVVPSACSLEPAPNGGSYTDLVTICPYKGAARYHDVVIKGTTERISNLVWTYPRALAECKAAEGLLAFYAPGPRCILVIDDERTS